MMHRLLARFIYVPLLLCAVSAEAGTFYVSTTGIDTNPGTQAAPWKTIQHAANVVSAGDTVMINAGSYPGGITQSRSGVSGAPITFKAVTVGTVVIHGEQTAQTDAF